MSVHAARGMKSNGKNDRRLFVRATDPHSRHLLAPRNEMGRQRYRCANSKAKADSGSLDACGAEP